MHNYLNERSVIFNEEIVGSAVTICQILFPIDKRYDTIIL